MVFQIRSSGKSKYVIYHRESIHHRRESGINESIKERALGSAWHPAPPIEENQAGTLIERCSSSRLLRWKIIGAHRLVDLLPLFGKRERNFVSQRLRLEAKLPNPPQAPVPVR